MPLPTLTKDRCGMQQTRESYYSDSTRTKISPAESHERRAYGLLNERKAAVHRVTTDVEEQREWHEQTVRALLAERGDIKARLGLKGLLIELSETHGLGWSELARLVSVSVPAVRKWRLGGEITAPRLVALSRLAALLELLGSEGVQDPAAWLSLPLDGDGGVSKSEFFTAGHASGLLLYAKQEMSRQDLLERAGVPAAPPSRNTMVRAEDGHLSIVPKTS